MASETPCDEYMIYRHEKISLLDLLSLLIFRRPLISHQFVACSSSAAARLEGVPADWITALTLLLLQKILSVTRTPLKWMGRVIEFTLNLISLNGGIRGLIWNVITVSVVIPKRDADNFRSFIAHLDGRIDLHKTNSWINFFPSMEELTGIGETDPLDLSMMAAKLAYENPAYVEDAVTKKWKMHFVGFYSCWNMSVVVPKRHAASYRSVIGHIDGRLELYKSNLLIQCFPLMDIPEKIGDINTLDLSMMAAKVAYENAAYVEDAVTNHWKMHFVGFFDCWNKFLEKKGTQAFIFCNKAEDADLIVLAFRGTELFDAQDWSTDVDLSWLSTGKMGNIHLGFLKALGLQDEKNFQTGFPKDYSGTPDKPVAYYALRQELRSLIQQHKNAKIVVTGHSLGGALAAIFPALLSFHSELGILSSMYGVITYGQPRVGDALFATYVETIVRLKHHRMVYRYDVVPRIPFDFPPVAPFKHFGTCIYYNGWYAGQVVTEAPNPNYFDPMYVVPMYWSAWSDLFKALLLGATQGQDYKESLVSILYRLSGLIIPGIAFHSPRDYVNAGRLAKIADKFMV